VIACHGFAESIDWPELCDAGAFHTLWLPLKENEVRQSLGFVWGSEKRLAVCAEVAENRSGLAIWYSPIRSSFKSFSSRIPVPCPRSGLLFDGIAIERILLYRIAIQS
jgi:hypothetical protein